MTTWKEARDHRTQRQDRERRHLTGDQLGRPCPDCGARVTKALNDAGITHHPTCGPDARALLQGDQ